ncbi:tyrosine-protein phosphatase non-receptor type 23-like [Seriola lalandi dorsalis]|uniref:tyrosine-protein phosphatase non-receptor type 23-like n=1 Tax=Seriola lalandi dorsalis TaxID=1841481 RepID=UPI000C6FBC96|nr:tyrosine-protein phosphatase non-receptor type 23-like [Seriola lalandi dorsalis]
MASWFSSCWIYLWIIVLSGRVSADLASLPNYTIHHTKVNFDQAKENCSPNVLTTLATEQEATEILRLISRSVLPESEFIFWVGLRKAKNECVVPALPLRGFKWAKDGSEESQVSRWMKEPQSTCTTVRCAALQVLFNQSAVTWWGLIPVTCKNSYQFICKLTRRTAEDRRTTTTLAAPEPPKHAAPEPPNPATPEPPNPDTPEPTKHVVPEPPKPATPEPPKPATPEPPNPATQEPPKHAAPEPPIPATPEPPKPATLEPPNPATREPPTPATPEPSKPLAPKPPKPAAAEPPRPNAPETGPPLGSDPCLLPLIPDARALSLDPDNSSRIQVECWSYIPLELHCWGHPAVWHFVDDSPANFTTICLPCSDGFHKDASANCVDIDECTSGARCRHTCLNTEGSYRCICSDENGKHHDEGSPACTDTMATDDNSTLTGILIAVAITVVVLVVLVVVILVAVKYCLMRRSEKRAMKDLERMAMKNKDGKGGDDVM